MHASLARFDASPVAAPRYAEPPPVGTAAGAPEVGIQLEPGSIEHVAHPEELPHGPWGMRLLAVSRLFALAGGVLFIALIAMSLVSIVGRKLFSLPVPGDFEILQMGAAVAAATFFAYCQMTDGHVRVDFFTNWLPRRLRAFLDGLATLLMSAVALLISWRTAVGAVSSLESGEASLMLGWPGWIAIALIVPSFVLFATTGLYIAARRFRIVLGEAK